MRIPIAVIGLVVTLVATQQPASRTIVTSAAEFPPGDLRLSMIQRDGLTAGLAAGELVANPDTVETVRLLALAKHHDGLLATLRRIVDAHAERIPDAFEAINEGAWQFRGDGESSQQRAAALQEIVADARKRLPEIAREDAARAERVFITLDGELDPDLRKQRQARLARFRAEYGGTEAALLGEVDEIASRDVSRRMFDELDAVIRARPGTTVAAKALYQKGFQWHTINTLGRLEPRGADPVGRFLRVVEIVEELESGRYPASEWVTRAPELITGFFVPQDATFAPESLDRMIEVLEARARHEFTRRPDPLHDEHPAGNGVGYMITRKLADLHARKGDRSGGVERLLAALERTVADAAPVRYLRALFYMQSDGRESADDREAMLEKARQELLAVSSAASGLYHRKALATLANLGFQRGDYANARAAYRRYARTYPESAWAWVALVRAGHCDEELGEAESAAATYLGAAAAYELPLARVLGHEYAARVFEQRGELQRALVEHQRALAAWDNAFGLRYSTYAPWPASSRNPFEIRPDPMEVAKDQLSVRITQLARTLREPGGDDLERGRALLARGRFEEAARVLRAVFAKYPGSEASGEARALAHRARLERALQLADVEYAGADESTAITELQALAHEPVDFAVTAARIALASILWTRGDGAKAEQSMADALAAWHALQRVAAPAGDLETDVAAIRRAVFRPRGGGIYSSRNWNAFSWPSSLSPYLLVNADVLVKQHDGEVTRVSLIQTFDTDGKVICFEAGQIAVLKDIITRLGGTKRRRPGHVMETPNQPIGDSMQILRLWTKFFAARPGHWGGWELETYPVITEIQFADPERTKASARVTIGYSGGTVELEKENGRWVAKRLAGIWIT